jgi:novobiocin biosynthesis protein NovU/D-mycarose 3-C-methyltransferase
MTTTCRACDGSDLAEMIDFGSVPLAGGFLDPDQVAGETTHPLVVHICNDCTLVQILQPIDPDILFQDYSFSASTIPGLVKHFDGYAQWLVDRFSPDLVVEFGCNDGVLLDPLKSRGVRTAGADISKNIGDLARGKGLDVVSEAYTPEVARSLREQHGPADVVTGSNAFAHNDEPGLILEAAAESLKPGGALCLEVMYAGDLYEQIQWDTLYHEHLTFYALAPLQRLLGRYGFTVVHAERIPMHGGSLRVVAVLGDGTPDATVEDVLAFERRIGIDDVQTWLTFADDARRTISVVSDVMRRLSENATIWGYGAAGKATMWVNLTGMDYLAGMVDASPLRAGKLMPGTHTPIVSPAEFQQAGNADFVFVTAWNYLDAIRRNEAWFTGTWVTPLPSLSFQ